MPPRSCLRWMLPLALPVLLASAAAANPIVRFTTPLGAFDVELCESVSIRCLGAAPETAARFLADVEAGVYEGSFVERRAGSPPALLQGGRLIASGGALEPIPAAPPLPNEFNQSNRRGTLALPLPAGQPDSGSRGWFANLDDNGSLDPLLFTVFGVVLDPGLAVLDGIAALEVWNVRADLPALPLIGYPGSGDPLPYLVTVSIAPIPEPGTLGLLCAGHVALACRARRAARSR